MQEDIPLTIGGGIFHEPFYKTTIEDVENYLTKQSWSQQEVIMQLAKNFQDDNKPLSPTISLIPVAAHQESERIIPAMDELARQQTESPFSVLLYLNAPTNADYRDIKKTLCAVKKAKSTFPDLDIRSSDVHEFTTPIIGKIRKNLWDSALYLAREEDLFDKPGDVIGFNHDIDIEWMGRSLVRNVQRHYDEQRHIAVRSGSDYLRVAGTQLRHAYDHERPNVSKVVQWRDLAVRVRSPYSTFEAGIVVPFSTYARSGGIEEDAATYETANLTGPKGPAPRIKRTLQTTSPRRFGDRLHDVGLPDVWGDDAFGANDICRTDKIRGDISEKRAKKLIKESLDVYMPWFFLQPIRNYSRNRDEDKLQHDLEKRKHLAITVLKRFDTSEELAGYVDNTYSVPYIANEVENNRLFAISFES